MYDQPLGRSMFSFRLPEAVGIIAIGLILGLSVPGMSRAEEAPPGQECRSGETKMDEGCATNPKVIHKVEPSYPRAAWKAGAEGSVTLSARVNIKGRVEEITVRSSTATDEEYRASFEQAARDALAHWRYRPGRLNEKAVPMYFEITIDFHID